MLIFLTVLLLGVVAFSILWGSIAFIGNRSISPKVKVVAAPAATTTPPSSPAPQPVVINNRQTKQNLWLQAKSLIWWIVLATAVIFVVLWVTSSVSQWTGINTPSLSDSYQWLKERWMDLIDGIPPFWTLGTTWLLIVLLLMAIAAIANGIVRWAAIIGIALIIAVWQHENIEMLLTAEQHTKTRLPNGWTLYHPFKIELDPVEWKDVPIPPRTCATANPAGKTEFVRVQPDLTQIRSNTGQKETIFLTWKRSGECS